MRVSGRALALAFAVAGALAPAAGTSARAARAIGFSAGSPITAAGQLCRSAIASAEVAYGIPPQLLAAIADVETGRRDPVNGRISPWPWTIDARGQGQFFASKQAAVAAVAQLQAGGVHTIDVGCLQVDLRHHPHAFPSLAVAFDPVANADYAAGFLRRLHDRLGSWRAAAAAYHSMTPALGAAYEAKVMAAWPMERRLAGLAPPTGLPAAAMAPGTILPPFRAALGPLIIPSLQPPPRIIRLPQVAGMAPPGKGLAAYRRAPIARAGGMRPAP
ncbi:MAG: transglycosylase SLT domain-containing protein [Acetobacteraceae bacterium]